MSTLLFVWPSRSLRRVGLGNLGHLQRLPSMRDSGQVSNMVRARLRHRRRIYVTTLFGRVPIGGRQVNAHRPIAFQAAR